MTLYPRHPRQGAKRVVFDSRPMRATIPDTEMTVAIACLFSWRPEGQEPEFAVLTAADRMISIAEIEFEPPQAKTWVASDRVHVLIAGTYSIHAKAMNRIREGEYGEVTVHSFAQLYKDALAEQQRLSAEAAYLQPLGLTLGDLNDRKNISESQAEFLSRQIQGHPAIDALALVVGCDGSQGQIYTVSAKELTCETETGWAVIGSGYYPAASEFTSSAYSKNAPFQTALFTSYRAKKAGESASSVGRKTDLIHIMKSGFFHINSVVMETLEDAERVYDTVVFSGRQQAQRHILSRL